MNMYFRWQQVARRSTWLGFLMLSGCIVRTDLDHGEGATLGDPCAAEGDCAADLRCQLTAAGPVCTADCAADEDCGEGNQCIAATCRPGAPDLDGGGGQGVQPGQGGSGGQGGFGGVGGQGGLGGQGGYAGGPPDRGPVFDASRPPDYSWPPDIGVGGSGGAIEDWGPPPPRDAEPEPVDASRPPTACEEAVERILVCGLNNGLCQGWQNRNAERDTLFRRYLSQCESSPALAVLVNNYEGDCARLLDTLFSVSDSFLVDCQGQ